jgi:hypothetical protein
VAGDEVFFNRSKMNIFVLDRNQELCAQYHNNKHIVKMILESTQLLSTAYYEYGPVSSFAVSENESIIFYNNQKIEGFPRLSFYKPTHRNHICAKWARSTQQNWEWLLKLGKELCKEYTFRFKKTHSCESILEWMELNPPKLKDDKLEEFVCAMPKVYYETVENPIISYRLYYTFGKDHLANWGNRGEPQWHKDFKGSPELDIKFTL